MLDNLQTVAVILLPMFVGFCFRLPAPALRLTDHLLNVCVYLILLLIGMGLAQVENLGRELGGIAFYALLLFALLTGCNLAAMRWFDRRFAWQPASAAAAPHQVSFANGLKQLATVLLGLVLGLLLPAAWLPHQDIGHYTLMAMIFLVGLQLRGGGIPLRQILLNRRGLQLSVVFMLSCAAAGLLFALCVPKVSVWQGLALSSGYGWYSLSGMLMAQSYGAAWGSVALLNDLLRELFALAVIPVLMRRTAYSAVGIGGATSMDFALPVIQHAGGLAVVPVAVSFGFVVNLAAPLMMVLFGSMG